MAAVTKDLVGGDYWGKNRQNRPYGMLKYLFIIHICT
jgi:hypothetical protein